MSAEQQKFFADSKVVDKNGNLLAVYHGTNNEFYTFDSNKIGESTRNEGIFGKGFYFTNNQTYAEYYKRKNGNLVKDDSGRIVEAYLNLKNPFIHYD